MTRYEFIKIEGPIAYLLDQETGEVVIRQVRDETGGIPRMADRIAPAQMENPSILPSALRESSKGDAYAPKAYTAPEKKEPEPSYAPANQPAAPGDLPRPTSILPLHLKGVFSEHGSGAEAVERRTV